VTEQPDRTQARTLLAELETRQQELLRLLEELEMQTKQALARFSVCDPATLDKAA